MVNECSGCISIFATIFRQPSPVHHIIRVFVSYHAQDLICTHRSPTDAASVLTDSFHFETFRTINTADDETHMFNLKVAKDFELFYEAAILVASRNPQRQDRIIASTFCLTSALQQLVMLHPVLQPNGCRRLFF